MSIDISVLEAALAPLEEVGQGEVTFPVNGVDVTLRMVLPEQEIEVQRHAVQVFEEGGTTEDRHSVLDYADRLKRGVLSYALVQIGDIDLRDVDRIETGEETPKGKPITEARHEVMRRLVAKWTRPILTNVFAKYVEMSKKVSDKADEVITFEPSDLQTEIERTEERLKDLKEEMEESITPSMSFQEELENVAGDESGVAPPVVRRRDDEEDENKIPEPPKEAPPGLGASPAVQRRRQPITPQTAPPPQRTAAPAGASEPHVMGQIPQGEIRDSMVDSSDQEAMMRAVAEENRRLMAQRRTRSGITRVPPHAAAAQAAQEFEGEESRILSKPVERAGVSGVQLQQTEELSRPKGAPQTRVVINANPDPDAAKNPRFRGNRGNRPR